MFETLRTMKINRRRVLGAAVGSAAGAALLSACSMIPSEVSAEQPVELNLSLVSDAMTGKQNWPVYVPSTLTLPAHTTINARIFQFDSGAGELPDDSPFAKVTGVVGSTATAQAITQADPNNLGAASTYPALAAKDVAHTFTIGQIGLNVPLPVSSVVSFTFKTGDPGTLRFQCMVPCGTDPNGSGGPMVANGFMMGTIKVV
jgi:hypothetical protein